MKEDNFEEYSIEDEEDDKKPSSPQSSSIWNLLLKTMVMPSSGWKEIKTKEIRSESVSLAFFLPFCIIASLSDFFTVFYEVRHNYAELFVEIITTFFTFFVGYYICVLIAGVFLPHDDKPFATSNYGKIVQMAGITSLAIYHILYEAFPFFDFIIEFLPIWTVYLVYKAMALADIKSNKATYSLGVICVGIIGSPVLVEWLLSLITPENL